MAHPLAATIPLPPPPGPAQSWSLAVTDPESAVPVRRAFRAHLERYAVDGSDIAAAELIFAELVSNVVRHAPGPAVFYLSWRHARPTLVVLDTGRGFAARPAMARAPVLAERGRGLALVRALGLQTRLGNRAGDGAYVCVVLPISR